MCECVKPARCGKPEKGGDCGKQGARAPSEGAATLFFNESQPWVSVSPALSVAVTVAEAEIKCCSVSGNN